MRLQFLVQRVKATPQVKLNELRKVLCKEFGVEAVVTTISRELHRAGYTVGEAGWRERRVDELTPPPQPSQEEEASSEPTKVRTSTHSVLTLLSKSI